MDRVEMPIQHEKCHRMVVVAATTLASACLLAVGAAAPPGLRADPGERPAGLEAEIEGLSESLQRSRDQYDGARERARVAAGTEAVLASRISAGRARLAALQVRVSREGRRAASAGRSLTRARAILARRLVDIYMAGSPRIDDLLLASGDYGELVSRSIYLDAIGDSDRALAGRVAELRRARVAALRAAREGRADVRSELSSLEEEAAAMAAIRSEAETTASRLARLQGDREGEISELRDRIAKIEAEQVQGVSEGEAFLGGPYSIPTYIVMCESGGNYSALNPSSGAGGAYQIIPSTWEAYGGKGLPHQASKSEQDRIAALIWANDGPGAWVCA